eukprot:GGOE01008421.1.p1 GENE.GGOE01008421.1~~GGOE01008421.1.p1  ORF type:complete len:738 (-),score=100.42 GGOE01008421.1:840-3053(-)
MERISIHFDNEFFGLIHFLGTGGGKHRWKSPANSKVIVTASSISRGNPNTLVEEDLHQHVFSTKNETHSWVAVHFVNHHVKPSAYVLGHTSQVPRSFLRTWTFEASNDNENWEVLSVHVDDRTLNESLDRALFPVVATRSFFRHFRVHISEKGNSNLTNALVLSSIEVFGTMERVGTQSIPEESQEGNQVLLFRGLVGVTEDNIVDFVEQFGCVKKVEMKPGMQALVYLDSPEAARRSIAQGTQKGFAEINGSRVSIELADPKKVQYDPHVAGTHSAKVSPSSQPTTPTTGTLLDSLSFSIPQSQAEDAGNEAVGCEILLRGVTEDISILHIREFAETYGDVLDVIPKVGLQAIIRMSSQEGAIRLLWDHSSGVATINGNSVVLKCISSLPPLPEASAPPVKPPRPLSTMPSIPLSTFPSSTSGGASPPSGSPLPPVPPSVQPQLPTGPNRTSTSNLSYIPPLMYANYTIPQMMRMMDVGEQNFPSLTSLHPMMYYDPTLALLNAYNSAVTSMMTPLGFPMHPIGAMPMYANLPFAMAGAMPSYTLADFLEAMSQPQFQQQSPVIHLSEAEEEEVEEEEEEGTDETNEGGDDVQAAGRHNREGVWAETREEGSDDTDANCGTSAEDSDFDLGRPDSRTDLSHAVGNGRSSHGPPRHLPNGSAPKHPEPPGTGANHLPTSPTDSIATLVAQAYQRAAEKRVVEPVNQPSLVNPPVRLHPLNPGQSDFDAAAPWLQKKS